MCTCLPGGLSSTYHSGIFVFSASWAFARSPRLPFHLLTLLEELKVSPPPRVAPPSFSFFCLAFSWTAPRTPPPPAPTLPCQDGGWRAQRRPPLAVRPHGARSWEPHSQHG